MLAVSFAMTRADCAWYQGGTWTVTTTVGSTRVWWGLPLNCRPTSRRPWIMRAFLLLSLQLKRMHPRFWSRSTMDIPSPWRCQTVQNQTTRRMTKRAKLNKVCPTKRELFKFWFSTTHKFKPSCYLLLSSRSVRNQFWNPAELVEEHLCNIVSNE